MVNVILAQANSATDMSNAIGQSLTPEDVQAAAAAVGGAGLFVGGMIIFWVIAGIIGLVFFIWWIILLVDLLNRDFEQKTPILF